MCVYILTYWQTATVVVFFQIELLSKLCWHKWWTSDAMLIPIMKNAHVGFLVHAHPKTPFAITTGGCTWFWEDSLFFHRLNPCISQRCTCMYLHIKAGAFWRYLDYPNYKMSQYQMNTTSHDVFHKFLSQVTLPADLERGKVLKCVKRLDLFTENCHMIACEVNIKWVKMSLSNL